MFHMIGFEHEAWNKIESSYHALGWTQGKALPRPYVGLKVDSFSLGRFVTWSRYQWIVLWNGRGDSTFPRHASFFARATATATSRILRPINNRVTS